MKAVQTRRWMWVAGVLLWLVISLPSLTRYPTPHGDEMLISQPALDFLARGQFGLTTVVDFHGSSENYVHSGRLLAMLLALTYQTLGLGLWQGRLLSTLGVLVGSAVMQRLAGRLYGGWAGLAAGLLYLFSWRMLYAGHFIRPEVWVIAAGLGLLLGLWRLHTHGGGWRGYALLGLLTAGAMDIYSSMILYALTIGALVVLLNWRRSQWGAIGGFALGGVLGSVYWVAVHVWPIELTTAVTQWQYLNDTLFQVTTHPALRTPLIGPILNLASRHFAQYFGSTRLSGVELAYALAGVTALLLRRSRTDGYLLLAAGLYFVVMAYLAPALNYTHLVNITPWVVLLTVGGVDVGRRWAASQAWSARVGLAGRAWLPLALTGPLLMAFALGTVVLSYRGASDHTAESYAARIRALLPEDGHLFGDSWLWFYLRDYDYSDDFSFVMLPANPTPDEARTTVTRILAARGIDVVLLRVALAPAEAPTGWGAPYFTALSEIVTAQCALQGVVDGPHANFESTFPPTYATYVYECKAEP